MNYIKTSKEMEEIMPGRLVIELENNKEIPFNYSLSTAFQGYLMELIDEKFAEKMHSSGYHPYSQFVTVSDGKIKWTVNVLDKEAEMYIVNRLLEDDIKSVHINKLDDDLCIVNKDYSVTTYEDLFKECYFKNDSRYVEVRFLTPTAFKQNNRYQFFPNIKLIFQSLMMKYDASSSENVIFDEELLKHFEENLEIVSYNLRSTSFFVNTNKMPAFTGRLVFKANGPMQMANLAYLLLRFGAYSGVGIKSGMGMGGIEVNINKGKEKRLDVRETQ
jgi:CRISPR-associated endoribonuclease cas6